MIVTRNFENGSYSFDVWTDSFQEALDICNLRSTSRNSLVSLVYKSKEMVELEELQEQQNKPKKKEKKKRDN